MYSYIKKLFWPIFLCYLSFLYVIFCWGNWWYGGSYSCRPMIDAYSILAFPLACNFKFALDKLSTLKKYIFFAVIFILVVLNLFQTFQYSHQIIHWDRMNSKAFHQVFLSINPPEDSVLSPSPSPENENR